MGNPLYEALEMTDGEIAGVEGWEAGVREALDELIVGLQQEAAQGKVVTPYSIYLSFMVALARAPHRLDGALAATSEAVYRLAFPRAEMPPL